MREVFIQLISLNQVGFVRVLVRVLDLGPGKSRIYLTSIKGSNDASPSK